MKIRFVRWDWKEQIDLKWFNEALAGVFNGKSLPSITEIDSYGDSNEIVVCSDAITKDQAQAIWEAYCGVDDKRHPYNIVVEIDLQETLEKAEGLRQKGVAEKERRAQLKRSGLKKLSKQERDALNLRE